ncbi:MAG: DNA-3-methyladenine glycosylase I [Clostridiales bacterium]|nr:DNA-3-methyladenine glycosylase I [Clostridiales bacterium]HBM80891.1 DNA-3-methyladenine glycosylase I [Clostridiaceae bacterium]
MKARCKWAGDDPIYIEYHDKEWGVPVHDDIKHFELIILEGAQAGLSWITILKRRENYRRAFDNFDLEKVARYNQDKINDLLSDRGIIRNRRKIEAAVANAKAFIKIQQEFGSFDKFIWRFVSGKQKQNNFRDLSEVPAKSDESDKMSMELKKRGFRFVGSTICYAYMQSAGLVNDHVLDCFRHDEVQMGN